jgi:hypothetical protein
MGKMEQRSAQRIANALHDVERAHKKLGIKMARLHKILLDEASDHAEQLGVDVAPLSGGTPKPPENP